ncbi:hypothetical protein Bbelb_350300 [Branchiostoma belcheri]|nr:hypothetical protein Bbelb_350300 [Branchiostoma belcheri]
MAGPQAFGLGITMKEDSKVLVGLLARDHPGGLTSKYCTGLPPPATTESTEQTEHDLETLQEQHKALVAALEKAKLAKEVRDMEAALEALKTSAPPLTTGTLPLGGTPAPPLPTHAALPTSPYFEVSELYSTLG